MVATEEVGPGRELRRRSVKGRDVRVLYSFGE